ncbi:MAG: hypothetical protein HY000_37960 [Planctomycetes bacterium]|nr:hypothetical protein [Planctomycetia bacterium]MBI3468825.1 hypothetical protein [Planctomycetota bacterium]
MKYVAIGLLSVCALLIGGLAAALAHELDCSQLVNCTGGCSDTHHADGTTAGSCKVYVTGDPLTAFAHSCRWDSYDQAAEPKQGAHTCELAEDEPKKIYYTICTSCTERCSNDPLLTKREQCPPALETLDDEGGACNWPPTRMDRKVCKPVP